MRSCKLDGCSKYPVARGLCDMHRKRLARYGSTDPQHQDWGQRDDHPLYNLWIAMKRRCYSKQYTGYINYGARGITVCDRWLKDFWAFVEDMGPRPSPKHSLGRIDNMGPYSPKNCRWETATQQARNKRSTVLTVELAAEIKRRSALGERAGDIATSMRLDYDNVRHVIMGNSWKDELT